MKYSNAAIQAFLFKERLHMTNAQCWKCLPTPDALAQAAREHTAQLKALTEEFLSNSPIPGADGIICPFDKDFPVLNPFSSIGERPYLLFYRGNLSLLEDLNRNVAVIGILTPDDSIVTREQAIVRRLVEEKQTIVSGLAKGCDTVAHQACLEAGGKTIAILPTHLGKIYPAQNRKLADQIVQSGGLLLTEYVSDSVNRYASVKRFPERDRLQALFSKTVILIASCRKDEGDSGSRYAMESAGKYQIDRYVMFNQEKDNGKLLFGLNQDLLNSCPGVKPLRHNMITALAAKQNPALLRESAAEQIRLDLD